MSTRQILWTVAIAAAVVFASNRLSFVGRFIGPR
jgi:hypothetical protein